MIHEDDVVLDVEGFPQCIRTARGSINAHLGVTQEFAYYHEVGFVIVNDEDACLGSFEFRQVFFLASGASCLGEVVLADGTFTFDPLGDLDDEGGALFIDAVNRDLTAHDVYELLNDGKAETCSFDVLGGCLIDTLECGEQVRDIFRLDADTRVGDHVDHLAGLVLLHLALDGEGD